MTPQHCCVMIVSNEILFANVKEGIRDGKDVKIIAKGNSMLPFIRTGDTVMLTKPHRLRTGMVVLVEPHPGFFILHRIVKLMENDMFLYGDGNLGNKELVPYSSVIAVVKSVYRGKRTINYGSLAWKLGNRLWPRNKFLRKYSLKLYRKSQKLSNFVTGTKDI